MSLAAAGLGLAGGARAESEDAALCRQNPAFRVEIMRSVIDEQIRAGRNPDFDHADPDALAQQAVEKGVADCAETMAREPGLDDAIAGAGSQDAATAWDAFNIACAGHHGSMGACVRAELASHAALKRLSATDKPPGANAIVETCALVLPQTPALAEWRVCVDVALAVHAGRDSAESCKTTVPWHAAQTGQQAGEIVAACLRGRP